MTARKMPASVMVDTCVWLDNYLGARPGADQSRAFIDRAAACDIELLYAVTSAKDVYYLVAATLKSEQRQQGIELTPAVLAADNETAWACVENMAENATAVGLDASDVWLAHRYKAVHRDFEDNLVVAAAQRAKTDYLVTNDERLIKHAPIAALAPADLLALLQAFDSPENT